MLVGAPLAEWRRAYRSSPLRHGRQRPAKRPPLAVRIRVLDRFARASSGPTSALRLPGLIALRRRHGRPASAADRWRQASRPSRTGPSAAPAPPFTTKRPHGAAPGFHSLASATDRPSALASRRRALPSPPRHSVAPIVHAPSAAQYLYLSPQTPTIITI